MTAAASKSGAVDRYRRDYMRLRESEGRGTGGTSELLSLPYLTGGAMAQQWQVHARSFRAFMRRIVAPMAQRTDRSLDVLDLGAGNGWLCYRLALEGHRPVASDLRLDVVDGLGAGAPYCGHLERMFDRVAARFDAMPFGEDRFDLAVFVSSLHCTSNLGATIDEVARVVRPGGRIAVLDSPFYRTETVGEAMVAERELATREHLGELADGLLALNSIEFLTRDRLNHASADSGVSWRRYRVLYPLWYELRPIKARLRRKRAPSRFDLWEGMVP